MTQTLELPSRRPVPQLFCAQPAQYSECSTSLAVNHEWPAMARQRATISALPAALIEALQSTLAITPADDGQRMAQREIITALETALEARRQRIVISQSTVSSIKWAGLLLQALLTLIAIAMVHRQPAHLRHRADAVCDRYWILSLADRCLQSTLYRRNLSRTGTPQAGRRKPSVGHPIG